MSEVRSFVDWPAVAVVCASVLFADAADVLAASLSLGM